MIQQPDIVIPDSVEMPVTECRITKNGVKIYTLNSEEFEVVRFSFIFRAGTSMQQKPFTASATVNMLSEGSRSMTGQEIAERLDFYGSNYDATIDRDYTYISFVSLSKFFRETANLAREIILHPAFNTKELGIYCSKRKQGLTIERQKIDVQSRELFGKALFGEHHPYGITSPESEYDNISREDLVALYNALYTAKNCFVVCSGKVTEEVLSTVAEIVDALPVGKEGNASFPEVKTTHRLFKEDESSLLSSIRIGRLLFARCHPDFVGMQVVATALGGYFGSRLMQNLREEHGYTYGVMAAMVNFEREGYLAIATQVAREHRDDALREIHFEIERLRNELMSKEELQMVKNMMIGEILRILDGPFGIADVTIENIMCGYDNHATEQSVQTILAITPEAVQQLAHKYLKAEDLVEVVVG
ncbi:MAG: insulinase family protein [Alistipes sp.]|nr:insulinase family protein [Alistipes sp.]